MILRIWIPHKPKKPLLFPNYCSKWRSLFPAKEYVVQIELFGNFLFKWSVKTHENSTPLIYLPLKWGFVNFLSFQSLWIGSIAQNENLETPKTLGFFVNCLKIVPSYARTMILRISILMNLPKKLPKFLFTITPGNRYCFLL